MALYKLTGPSPVYTTDANITGTHSIVPGRVVIPCKADRVPRERGGRETLRTLQTWRD